MIFVLKDNQVQEWDRAVSSHILRDASGADSADACEDPSASIVHQSTTAGSDFGTGHDLDTDLMTTGIKGERASDFSQKPWALEKLQMYFHHCKQNYNPQMVRVM